MLAHESLDLLSLSAPLWKLDMCVCVCKCQECLSPWQTPEFWRMMIQVISALLLTGDWETIRGMGVWMKHNVGTTPHWMIAAEAQAKGR